MIAAALAEIPAGAQGKLFSGDEVDVIIRNAESDRYKILLKQSVDEALKLGAFGAPWIWVTPPLLNHGEGAKSETKEGKKKGEPVFGSDR